VDGLRVQQGVESVRLRNGDGIKSMIIFNFIIIIIIIIYFYVYLSYFSQELLNLEATTYETLVQRLINSQMDWEEGWNTTHDSVGRYLETYIRVCSFNFDFEVSEGARDGNGF